MAFISSCERNGVIRKASWRDYIKRFAPFQVDHPSTLLTSIIHLIPSYLHTPSFVASGK